MKTIFVEKGYYFKDKNGCNVLVLGVEAAVTGPSTQVTVVFAPVSRPGATGGVRLPLAEFVEKYKRGAHCPNSV